MLDGNGKNTTLLDSLQPGSPEQLSEVALTGTRELRLILGVAIEVERRLPKHAERPLAAGVIPNTRRDDAVLARDARHLAKSPDRLRHEVNDELCQGGVERPVPKRQALRRSALHADPGVALLSCRNEGLRRIDGRHGVRSKPPDQLGSERARAAADIKDSLTDGDRREVGKLSGERR
jgi:hypothetical protein